MYKQDRHRKKLKTRTLSNTGTNALVKTTIVPKENTQEGHVIEFSPQITRLLLSLF